MFWIQWSCVVRLFLPFLAVDFIAPIKRLKEVQLIGIGKMPDVSQQVA